MKKTTLTRVNGQGFVNGSIPKKVLERNAMDILTFDDSRDFDDCCEFVETASRQTLMNFLREYDLSEDGEAVIRKYMGNEQNPTITYNPYTNTSYYRGI